MVSVDDLDIRSSEKEYPITLYDIAGVVGIVLTGVALSILYLSVKYPSKQRSNSKDDTSNKGGIDASR
jgi:hypothetical protein